MTPASRAAGLALMLLGGVLALLVRAPALGRVGLQQQTRSKGPEVPKRFRGKPPLNTPAFPLAESRSFPKSEPIPSGTRGCRSRRRRSRARGGRGRPSRRRGGRAPTRARAAARAAVEAGRDHGHADLVLQRLVDHRAEDDVGVLVGRRGDDLGRLVDLEQAEVPAAGDVEQDAGRALDRLLEQRRGDRVLGGLGGAVLAARRCRCPSAPSRRRA